jgi:hypothetical protein
MIREERIDDIQESLRLAIEGAQSQIWTAIPGIITAADLATQTVSVQPSIMGSVTDRVGNNVNQPLPLLINVPIVWPRGGGFALTFPVKDGDEVLVVFASRCIDSWWQSGGVGVPIESRMHDLSDGFAILAPTSQQKKLTSVSSTNAQLRTEAGDTYIEVTPSGKVKIMATSEIDLTAPAIKLNGAITQVGGISIDGKSFGTHQHLDPQGGTTGAPI